jgi:hypothetical protein
LRLILNAAALAAASPTLLFSDWKNAARLDRNESVWLLCTPVAAKRASQWQRSGPVSRVGNGAKMFVALHNVTNIFFEEARATTFASKPSAPAQSTWSCQICSKRDVPTFAAKLKEEHEARKHSDTGIRMR